MVSYMQTIMKGLVVGFNMGYLAMHDRALWGYTGKYEKDGHLLMFEYNELNPQNKLNIGAIGRPSKKLNLFSQFTLDAANKSDCLVGFRSKFRSTMLTSSMSSNGKVTSTFRAPLAGLASTWTGVVDLSKP